jgi:hypothetical protein
MAQRNNYGGDRGGDRTGGKGGMGHRGGGGSSSQSSRYGGGGGGGSDSYQQSNSYQSQGGVSRPPQRGEFRPLEITTGIMNYLERRFTLTCLFVL